MRRCRALLSQWPPLEGIVKHMRAWSFEEALDLYHCLMRQNELQSSFGQDHVQLRKVQAGLAQLESQDASVRVCEALALAWAALTWA